MGMLRINESERGEEMSIGVKSPIFYNYLIAALPPNILISYINDM